MIREYCDKCGKEIPVSEFILHPGEESKRWTVTRIEVTVSYGTDRKHGPIEGGSNFETTRDVLCIQCAKKFRIEP